MMNKETFFINNLAYTINIEENLASLLRRNLTSSGDNIEIRDLFLAYIKQSGECLTLKNQLNELSNKISKNLDEIS